MTSKTTNKFSPEIRARADASAPRVGGQSPLPECFVWRHLRPVAHVTSRDRPWRDEPHARRQEGTEDIVGGQ